VRAIVVANGEWPGDIGFQLRPGDLVAAVDGGALHLRRAGIVPHYLLGDFDSLPDEAVAEYRARGTRIRRYPVDKDKTDTHLALDLLAEQGYDEIVLLGVTGDRLDQTLATLLLAARVVEDRGVRLRVVDARNSAVILVPGLEARVCGKSGDKVSLIPLRDTASGISTQGLAYPLNNGSLPWGVTLGVSNHLTGARATVTLRKGLLLVTHHGDQRTGGVEVVRANPGAGMRQL